MGQLCTAVALSSSGEVFAAADTAGFVHRWTLGAASDVTINQCSELIPFASPVTYTDPYIDIDDEDVPLSVIGMNWTDDKLLSSVWPPKYAHVVGQPAPQPDQSLIDHMKTIDFVGYAPNIFYGKRYRNQVEDVDLSKQMSAKGAPEM